MTEEQQLSFRAPCPGCLADAHWRAMASVGRGPGDGYTSTDVRYRIDCNACGPAVPTPLRAQPIHRPSVASLSWLGRTA